MASEWASFLLQVDWSFICKIPNYLCFFLALTANHQFDTKRPVCPFSLFTISYIESENTCIFKLAAI